MLTPDSRLVLLDQLRAPEGYSLDAAVATTFTLDLTAALVPPLAFAGAAIRDRPDPLSALAAIRACTSKVDIFCQVGMVKVPTQHSPLFAFLEPMVHEVAPPAGKLFHPKIWFLRYVAEGLPTSYRLLCLSRNLTNDHSWDVALRLDSKELLKRGPANEPLGSLLASLPDRCVGPIDEARRARVLELAAEAKRVEWELPEPFREHAFYAFGVRGQRPEPDFTGYNHLVISPFAEPDGLERVTGGDKRAVIVSRAETLDRLPKDFLADRGPYYVVDSLAVAESPDDSDAIPAPPLLDGLHAKAYVVERNRRAHVFVGSCNASGPAFGGNVEFLVELITGTSKVSVAKVMSDDDGFRELLAEYSPIGDVTVPDSELEQKRLENALRALAARAWTVTVSATGADYAADVTSGPDLRLPDDVTASVELLTRKGHPQPLIPEDGTMTFSGLSKVDVTPFLLLRLRGRGGVEVGGVVLASLANDPEGRFDEILAGQVDTPEKFLRFLALLLNLDAQHLLAALAGKGTGTGEQVGLGPAPGVFEVVVRALAQAPSSIADLDRLVQQLLRTEQGQAVMPAGFAELWDVVQQAHATLEGASA